MAQQRNIYFSYMKLDNYNFIQKFLLNFIIEIIINLTIERDFRSLLVFPRSLIQSD